MKNLYMVTFQIDLMQFLVEASTKDEAIAIAEKRNIEFYKELNDNDNKSDGYEKSNYTAEVVDFQFLVEIIKNRNDNFKHYNDCVVYFGA